MTELNSTSFEQAIKSNKPTVIDFWAEWCMPCKIFAPVLEDVSDQMDGKADFCKLNIDDFGDIAQKYSITSIPTVIIFKDGAPVDHMIGVRAKEDVIAMVEKHL